MIQKLYNKYTHNIEIISKAISISVINQIVSSGTNFLLGLYLVRVLSPKDFGLYGIGFALCLFYAGIGNALFLTQMVVRIPDNPKEEQLAYSARVFILTLLFNGISALFLTSFLLFFKIFSNSSSQYLEIGFAITVLATTYLMKDFFIRHAYSFYKEKRALITNLSLTVGLGITLMTLFKSDYKMTATTAILSFSFAQAIAIIVGFFLAKLPIKKNLKSQILKEAKALFHGGKWSVIAHIIISIRSQAYTLIVATLMGPTGVARLNAARIFIAPATMLIPALGQVFLPRIANARATDSKKGYKIGLISSATMFGIVLIYSFVIIFSFPYISNIIIGSEYQSLFWLVFWWSVYNCLTTLRSGKELIIIAYKLFRVQAFINFIAALMALLFVYLLFIRFAEPGAIIGLILSEIIVLFSMWRITKKKLQKEN